MNVTVASASRVSTDLLGSALRGATVTHTVIV